MGSLPLLPFYNFVLCISKVAPLQFPASNIAWYTGSSSRGTLERLSLMSHVCWSHSIVRYRSWVPALKSVLFLPVIVHYIRWLFYQFLTGRLLVSHDSIIFICLTRLRFFSSTDKKSNLCTLPFFFLVSFFLLQGFVNSNMYVFFQYIMKLPVFV